MEIQLLLEAKSGLKIKLPQRGKLWLVRQVMVSAYTSSPGWQER